MIVKDVLIADDDYSRSFINTIVSESKITCRRMVDGDGEQNIFAFIKDADMRIVVEHLLDNGVAFSYCYLNV